MSNRLNLIRYNDYLKFVQWAKNVEIKYHTGASYTISEDIFLCKETEFDGSKVMVMKTPSFVCHWLYSNCLFAFIKDAILEECDIEKFEVPQVQRTEIGTSFDITPKPPKLVTSIDKKIWSLESEGWWYDVEFDNWAHESEHLPNNSTNFIFNSLNELEYKIQNWKLPKGLQFELTERYGDGKFILTII